MYLNFTKKNVSITLLIICSSLYNNAVYQIHALNKIQKLFGTYLFILLGIIFICLYLLNIL